MLDLIDAPSRQIARLLQADELNFSGTALAPTPRQSSGLPDDPNAVAFDGDAGRSLGSHGISPRFPHSKTDHCLREVEVTIAPGSV